MVGRRRCVQLMELTCAPEPPTAEVCRETVLEFFPRQAAEKQFHSGRLRWYEAMGIVRYS